ncbi:MAG: hypothetical protein RIA69_10785 [Cyclobacteriaceae bacterium]
MKKTLLSIIIATMFSNIYAQINTADSTVQVVGYWSINDTQSFDVTYEKYKIKEGDTTSREFIKYEVDITVKDSTANSYTIEWFYKNYEVQTENPLVQKLTKLAEDLPVVMKTDEFGAVQEVVNWEEVRDYIQKATKILKKELKKVPNGDQIIAQVMGIYMSKEAIEGNAIKDALQFYTFHGGAYTLNEKIAAKMQLMNNFGGEPFDTDVTVSLDEIDEEGGTSIIRMYQEVNSKQLTDATYEYLNKLGTLGNQMPSREEFPALTNKIWTANRIHAGTGWTTYSLENKEVHAEGTTNIEERIIQIK